MKEFYAVLLDTVSIQKYIYSSNRLKDNLGASHLVKNIYDKPLISTLNEILPCGFSEAQYHNWETIPEVIGLQNDPCCMVEIGYIGGGNAILFFSNIEHAKKFVQGWSLKLLLEYPGIQTAVALERLPAEYFVDSHAFKAGNTLLFTALAENKNRYHPCTFSLKHGITADCRESGFSAEVYKRVAGEDNRYISVISAKKKSAVEEASKEVSELYSSILKDKYTFTSRLDQLGQTTGDSHLAVVHIDGNNMAKRFREVNELKSLRQLSSDVRKATEDSFKKLLTHIIGEVMPIIEKSNSGFEIAKDENNKRVIPLRYIVLGGDDITFVTDGRLGVYFAEKFMEYFSSKKLSDVKKISACAGIAIVKTKYPFFRAYELAEDLCINAKKESRKHGDDTSWLDFHIAYSGFSGNIEAIREQHYRVDNCSLLFGPYRLSGEPKYHENHFSNLKNGMRVFKQKWPRSKCKDLRLILSTGPAGRYKLADFKSRGLLLPVISADKAYQQSGWLDIEQSNSTIPNKQMKTPYFDMLELMEFYPDINLDSEIVSAKDPIDPEGG